MPLLPVTWVAVGMPAAMGTSTAPTWVAPVTTATISEPGLGTTGSPMLSWMRNAALRVASWVDQGAPSISSKLPCAIATAWSALSSPW